MKVNNDLVTVIVPIYNRETSVERCVQSIREQTYSTLEIILVNDGSLDNSGKICDEMAKKDLRIKVIHKSNGGVSSARNCGIENASGKYVMFVDGDDYLLENTYIEKMVLSMKEKNVGMVISGYTNLYDTHKKEHKPEECWYLCKNDFFSDFKILYEQYFLHSVCNKIFLKEKMDCRFMEEISLGEDCIFVFEYLKNIEKIYILDNAAYGYCMGTIDSLTKKVRIDAFELGEKIYINVKQLVQNNESALQSIRRVFIDDATKAIREISNNTMIIDEQKDSMLKNIAFNENFRDSLKHVKGIGYKQRVMLILLSRGYVRVVKSMYKMFR